MATESAQYKIPTVSLPVVPMATSQSGKPMNALPIVAPGKSHVGVPGALF